jgi:hypothetical protein
MMTPKTDVFSQFRGSGFPAAIIEAESLSHPKTGFVAYKHGVKRYRRLYCEAIKTRK